MERASALTASRATHGAPPAGASPPPGVPRSGSFRAFPCHRVSSEWIPYRARAGCGRSGDNDASHLHGTALLAPNAPHPARRTVLLTGDRGLVGRWLRRALEGDGWQVRGFDIRDGHDIRDAAAVRDAASGAAVTIHCAALPHDSAGDAAEVTSVNLHGGTNALAAAEAHRHERVILFSSAQVFGVFDGEQPPTAFPISDRSPRLARRPYGASKVALEDAAESFTLRTGIPTLCFRPVHVWVPGQAADTRRRWQSAPELEGDPFWNFGAFVDIRDMVAAVRLALHTPLEGHQRMLLCADDAAATRPTTTLTGLYYPSVAWRPGTQPAADSTTALFDTSEAQRKLGWKPKYTWAETSRETLLARLARRLRQPFPP